MLAPLSWLKEYVDIDVSAKELETLLFSAGFEVEELKEVGPVPFDTEARHFDGNGLHAVVRHLPQQFLGLMGRNHVRLRSDHLP